MAQQQQDIRVGWIGLGEMGLEMANNLQKYLASNSSQLTVWNRSVEKTVSVKELGAHVANSIEDLVSKSNVIFTSLSNDAAVENVYGQLFELASKSKEPLIFVETSTIHPTTAKKNVEQLSAFPQHTYLQCPVFGRPPAAHAAQLIWVASGNAEAIQKLAPYFNSMSKATIDLKTTDVTIGSTFKLIGNFFVVGTLELLAEGLTFAEKSGVDQQAVLKLIGAVFPSPAWMGYSQLMVDQTTSKAGGFPVDLGLKDVRHMRSVAEENGAVLPTADLAYKHLEVLREQGKGDQDWSTIIQVLKDSSPSKL
ncbi:hypothetical protein BGZ76_004909 [Entomortierella beljakovae]|nr:hypothetical protein BGZ76_004909 [Entomortierella beljakovae]